MTPECSKPVSQNSKIISNIVCQIELNTILLLNGTYLNCPMNASILLESCKEQAPPKHPEQLKKIH